MDVLLLGKKFAQLIDWKFGYNQVEEAKYNMQGMGYALAVFESYPDIDEVMATFIQPRCNGFVTSHTYTRVGDFDNMQEEIADIIDKCEEPNATRERNVDRDNCRFCAIRGECPAMVKVAVDVSKSMGYKLPKMNLSKMDDPKVRGEVLRIATWMEEWAKGVKSSTRKWF